MCLEGLSGGSVLAESIEDKETSVEKNQIQDKIHILSKLSWTHAGLSTCSTLIHAYDASSIFSPLVGSLDTDLFYEWATQVYTNNKPHVDLQVWARLVLSHPTPLFLHAFPLLHLAPTLRLLKQASSIPTCSALYQCGQPEDLLLWVAQHMGLEDTLVQDWSVYLEALAKTWFGSKGCGCLVFGVAQVLGCRA